MSKWTAEEDSIIINYAKTFGKKWANISKELPGRTESKVKNRFISLFSKEKKLYLKEKRDKSTTGPLWEESKETSEEIEKS